MKATELLHNLGQSLWLDNITRDLLDDGTLKRCFGWSAPGRRNQVVCQILERIDGGDQLQECRVAEGQLDAGTASLLALEGRAQESFLSTRTAGAFLAGPLAGVYT